MRVKMFGRRVFPFFFIFIFLLLLERGGKSREESQSVRGGVGDVEVGSGDYRLSGVFHL